MHNVAGRVWPNAGALSPAPAHHRFTPLTATRAQILQPEVVTWCALNNIVIIPGCQTPSEAYNAYKAGAPVQKIFPGVAGGHMWVKAVSAAMPMLKLNPTSGEPITRASHHQLPRALRSVSVRPVLSGRSDTVPSSAGLIFAGTIVERSLPPCPPSPCPGVDLDNAADFLKNGASSIGLVAPLFPPDKIASADWDAIHANAKKVIGNVKAVTGA